MTFLQVHVFLSLTRHLCLTPVCTSCKTLCDPSHIHVIMNGMICVHEGGPGWGAGAGGSALS